MTQYVTAGEEVVVEFCCQEFSDGGMTLVSDADAHFVVPQPGVHLLTSTINYYPVAGNSEPAAFSWMTAEFSVTSESGEVRRPVFGWCHVNFGMITLATQTVLDVGDEVRVLFLNGSQADTILDWSCQAEVTWLRPPTEVQTCGSGSTAEPEPYVPPVEWFINTAGMGFNDAPAQEYTYSFVLPFDATIAEFVWEARNEFNPYEPGYPVFEVLVNGSNVIAKDAGDILPEEYPVSWTYDLFCPAGSPIEFRIQETGGAEGYIRMLGVPPDAALTYNLAWI